jgi:hypothetical protein
MAERLSLKGLLLGSSAGLLAASGTWADDLPIKTKPVDYVRVCSLYGAGFYYIPGTDICMKIGGYVRYQVGTGIGNSVSFGPFRTSSGMNTRVTTDDVAQRVRLTFGYDTRQQTAYGILRTFLILGWVHDTPAQAIGATTPALYFNRGFIQFAGFTFGKAISFFDFTLLAAVTYHPGFLQTSGTRDTGHIVGAYTAQFGNGVSATLAIEQSRRAPTVAVAAAGAYSFAAGGSPGSNNLGGANAASRPDFIANWRTDQVWGSAQVAGAVHDVSAAYYNAGVVAGINELNSHPGDKWGWAIMGGLRLNTPMISQNDYFQANVIYAEGAIRYAAFNGSGNNVSNSWSGNTFAWGVYEDANFGGTAACPAGGFSCPFGNSINLTTAWSVFASYEHFWTPALRTSLYGSHLSVSRNSAGNALVCAGLGIPVGVPASGGVGSATLALPCNMNFQTWQIGSRSQWNITPDFYVGVDVIYQKLQGMTVNNNLPILTAPPPGLGKPVGFYSTADQDAVSVTWRAHRDIVP